VPEYKVTVSDGHQRGASHEGVQKLSHGFVFACEEDHDHDEDLEETDQTNSNDTLKSHESAVGELGFLENVLLTYLLERVHQQCPQHEE
jgi:hypothetical protein